MLTMPEEEFVTILLNPSKATVVVEIFFVLLATPSTQSVNDVLPPVYALAVPAVITLRLLKAMETFH
jgi:hypothetical protein